MMQRRLHHWLIVLLLTSGMPLSALAADADDLYTNIRQSVINKDPKYGIDLSTLEYVTAVAKEEDSTQTATKVEAVLNGEYINTCDKLRCTQDASVIQKNYDKVLDTRLFTEQLQHIAQSYEAGTIGVTGHPDTVANAWPSISSIWESGIDTTLNTTPSANIRYEKLDTRYDTFIDDIRSELEGLITTGDKDRKNYDELNGAILRYHHGFVDLVADSTCSAFNSTLDDNKTLLYNSVKRHCALEELMQTLLEELEVYDYDPPLRTGETAIFTSSVLEEEDVYIWIRNDDIGFNWINGIRSPQLTNLVEEEIIPATWEYTDPPEEPAFNKGICSHPLAKEGYMCRPVSSEQCPVTPGDCLTNPDTGACINASTTDGYIGLLKCEPKNFAAPIRSTQAGQDICQVGAWLEQPSEEEDGYGTLSTIYHDTNPAKNPNIKDELNECSNCVIELHCASSCPGGADGFAKVKSAEGVQEICLKESIASDPAMIYYLALHEVVHAQQMCGLPPNTNLFNEKESCCATERDAYLVMCNALWEDGILQQTDYTVDDCASAYSNASCKAFGANACTTIPMDFQPIATQIVAAFNKDRSAIKTPQTCQNVIREPTDKLKSLIASSGPVCNPNCAAKYKNTIGNNLCYMGQCTEQSWEQHRLVPGRTPTTVQEQAFPWESCINPDPQLGTVTSSTAVKVTRLPLYEPYRLVETLDKELCGQNGFPLRTPAVLCMFGANEQFNLEVSNPSIFTSQLERNATIDAALRSITGNAVGNVTNRYGSTMLRTYLQTAIPTMNETLSSLQSLLKQMGTIQLPTVMCPREPITSCTYFNPPSLTP